MADIRGGRIWDGSWGVCAVREQADRNRQERVNIAPPEYLLTGFEELGSNFSIPCWEASRQEWDLTKRVTHSVAC